MPIFVLLKRKIRHESNSSFLLLKIYNVIVHAAYRYSESFKTIFQCLLHYRFSKNQSKLPRNVTHNKIQDPILDFLH